MLIQVLILIVAIVMLYYGAEFALEAAEKIGLVLGLSPLVIGLLIVGFGTSLPEFFVSQLACLRGESEIALGNIVGSNLANLLLILGVSGLMTTLYVQRKEIRTQFIFHVVLTTILSILLLQERLFIWGGCLLVAFFGYYLWDTFKQMSKEKEEQSQEIIIEEKISIKDVTFLLLGFILLYFGGEYLVSSSSSIAVALGISSYVISAVFIAFGTSFPELVTAIVACMKKKDTDIITGNIIGSNIFNVAFVMGSLTFYDIEITKDFTVEICLLVFLSLYLLALPLLKKNFSKVSGVIFLSLYFSIVYYWVVK